MARIPLLHRVVVLGALVAPLWPTNGTGLIAADQASDEAIEQDVIHLNNGHRLRGQLEGDAIDSPYLTIVTASGSLRLQRENIAEIERGFSARRAALDPDDVAGHIDLARWALAKQRRDLALELLDPWADHAALDVDSVGLLAQLRDSLRGPEDAVPLYQRYRQAGGSDATLLARLVQLETAMERHAAQLAAWEAEQGSRPPPPEGLEATASWNPDNPQWANPTQIGMTTAANGNRQLQLRYRAGKHKAVARHTAALDLRGSPILRLQVRNPESSPVSVSIAVKSGDSWTYFESRTYQVPADDQWHIVDIDLSTADFKSEASGWAPNVPIADADAVKELQLQVHNGQRDGTLLIDGIGFLPRP